MNRDDKVLAVADALVKIQLAQRLLETPTKQTVRDAERALAQAEARVSVKLAALLEESENSKDSLPRSGRLFAS